MPTEAPIPMTFEQAKALLQESAAALGKEHERALVVLLRYAERGRRPSSMRLAAVGDAALGAQHFAKATADLRGVQEHISGIEEELVQGLAAVQRGARAIRDADVEDLPDAESSDRGDRR